MKKIITYLNSNKYSVGAVFLIVAFMVMSSPLVASAAMTRQLQLGMSGSDVSELQMFLAKDISVYPSGLVTGYFGGLTKAAVERFQSKNGIVSSGTQSTTGYGRVGPTTMALINAQMNGGNASGGNGVSPSVSSLNVSTSNTSANLNWNTNENSSGVVYYGTSFPSMIEGSPSTAVTIGGSSILAGTNLQTSHSATMNSLLPNTTYYYVVYARDGSGNESITWPATFQTSN